MKNKDFKKILFRSAFAVMACDGEIAESEVVEIKEMLQNSLYFDGLDHEVELQSAFEDMKENGLQFIQNFFQILKTSDLSERQELQMIEVLIKMIHADDKVDENELIFMHNIRSSLSILSDAKIMINFPQHIDLLLNLSKFDSKPFQSNLDSIDLKAFDDMDLTN